MTGTDTDPWRTKYYDSLGRLDEQQLQFRAMETALKRLVGRRRFRRDAGFDRADKALYRAKQEGRNRCVTA